MSTSDLSTQSSAPASIWRNRNYLLLWGGQVVSSIGTQVSDLAYPLLVLVLTNSPAQAGFVGAVGMLPYLIFSLPAGALVDRWNRKRVMLVCDTGRAICLGSIPLTYVIGHLTLVQLYLVSLIEGTLFVFFNLAEVACLPRVVRKEHLPAVAAQTEFTNSLSSLLGQSLGGILFSLGRLLPFLTDAISYLVSVISLCFVNVPLQEKRAAPQRALRVEIWEGLHWLWRQPLLCFIALLGSAVHIFGGGMILIVIVQARQQHASPLIIGLILAVGGVGTMLGAFLGGLLQKRYSFARLTILTQWLSALFFPLYIFAPNEVWLAVVIAIISAVMTIYGVIQFSYRLTLIPDELQGRVNSVFRLVVFAGDPIGLALTGALLQAIGVAPTVWLYTVLLVLLALVTVLNRSLRSAKQ
ncbi:MAG: MFS transporter [Ktedonobacteraceae bacterium]